MHINHRRKNYNQCYYKREPKQMSDFREACGFCGMTCCGPHGAEAKLVIRAIRRRNKKLALEEEY